MNIEQQNTFLNHLISNGTSIYPIMDAQEQNIFFKKWLSDGDIGEDIWNRIFAFIPLLGGKYEIPQLEISSEKHLATLIYQIKKSEVAITFLPEGKFEMVNLQGRFEKIVATPEQVIEIMERFNDKVSLS